MEGSFTIADFSTEIFEGLDEEVSILQNLTELLVLRPDRGGCQFGSRMSFHILEEQKFTDFMEKLEKLALYRETETEIHIYVSSNFSKI